MAAKTGPPAPNAGGRTSASSQFRNLLSSDSCPACTLSSESSPADLHPHLLYRVEDEQARFATWRMTEGHEVLAIFTTAETATTYRAALADADGWTIYQPPRAQVIEILAACRGAGILYAALDPVGGGAKTLFDIPQVLRAAVAERSGPTG